MNKCKKCGTEFEGRFCPECGEAWLAEGERLCPLCKKVMKGDEKFCPECGYSFVKGAALNFSQRIRESASIKYASYVVYHIAKYLPEILFLLFSMLAFAFFAAPVVKLPPESELLGIENIGNAYKVISAEGINEIRNPAIAQIAFAAAGMVFAFVSSICASRFGRSTHLAYGFFAFYLADLIINSVMIANTAAADGGLGFLKAGACPICFIVFSILFAAGHAASIIVYKVIKKIFDIEALGLDVEAIRQEKAQEKKAQWERYYAMHEERLTTVYKIVKYLPEALFLLISALVFAFLAAPVTKVSDMGQFLGAADMGSAYTILTVDGVGVLRGCAIAFMVFAALGAVYSLYLIFVNIPDLKDGFFVKPTYTAFAFYLAYVVIGCVMIANTAALDGGMGVLSAGACPICFLVFSILFAAITVVALILRNKLGAAVKRDSVRKN